MRLPARRPPTSACRRAADLKEYLLLSGVLVVGFWHTLSPHSVRRRWLVSTALVTAIAFLWQLAD